MEKVLLTRKKIRRGSAQSRLTYRLYMDSFPPIERIPYRVMMQYSRRGNVDFWAYFDGDAYIGFAYLLKTEEFAYLLYCAVTPELRSRGYGSEIIRDLRVFYSDRDMVLDIEPLNDAAPNAAQRIRRSEFYIANGFRDTFWEMTDDTGDFRIFTTAEDFDIDVFRKTFEVLPLSFEGTELVDKRPVV